MSASKSAVKYTVFLDDVVLLSSCHLFPLLGDYPEGCQITHIKAKWACTSICKCVVLDVSDLLKNQRQAFAKATT